MKFSEFKKESAAALSQLSSEELARLTHRLQTTFAGDSAGDSAYGTAGEGSAYEGPFELPEGIEIPATIEWDVPLPPPLDPAFRFIDLFAGIGGIRTALQNLGGACVFSSEWNEYAQKTYFENFGEFPFGDITQYAEADVPDHEFLTAGFPCQAFSIAGKRRGFEEARGTLFFDVARIIKKKHPKVFLLENVKGLLNHDRGRTISVILDILRNELKYYVPDPQIVNAKYFGVPQNRERVIIVGFAPELGIDDFEYPEGATPSKTFKDIREKKAVSSKYYLSTRYFETLKEHKARHAAAGHGFGYQIIPNDGVSGAIVVGGMGRERNLVVDRRQKDLTPVTNIKGEVNTEGVRRMTPREWARLQGFPEEFEIVVSDAQAYKQFGNSVAVPAIQAVAERILERLELGKVDANHG